MASCAAHPARERGGVLDGARRDLWQLGNWAITTLAAIFGTASMTPIAAAGHSGLRWQELAVTIGFTAVGLSILVTAGLLLFAFRRN